MNLMLVFQGCFERQEEKARVNSDESSVVISDSATTATADLAVRKITLVNGAYFYDTVICEKDQCSSLVESVARKQNIDLDDLIVEEFKELKLRGRAAVRRAIGDSNFPLNRPDLQQSRPIINKDLPRSVGKVVGISPRKESVASNVRPNQRTRAGDSILSQETPHSVHSKRVVRRLTKDDLFEVRLKAIKAKYHKEISILPEFVIDGKISSLRKTIGIGGEFQSIRKTMIQAKSDLDLSRDSIKRARNDLEAKLESSEKYTPGYRSKKASIKLLDALDREFAPLQKTLVDQLNLQGKAIAVISTYNTIRRVQLQNIISNKGIDPDLRRQANEAFSAGKYDHLSEGLSSALDSVPMTIMTRKVSNPGFEALYLGRPSKRLQLKAKSDTLGNIPIDSVFSSKVKVGEREMFSEFSFQSRAELLEDGLPNSIEKRVVKKVTGLDGRTIEIVGVKKKNALPEEEVEWVPLADWNKKSPADKNVYSEYKVHADPRSMTGSTEDLLAEWRRAKSARPIRGPPNKAGSLGDRVEKPVSHITHLDNTEWENPDFARGVIKDEVKLRGDSLKYAEASCYDYADFLVRKEIVKNTPSLKNPYGQQVDNLMQSASNMNKVLEIQNSAGKIAPDIDILSIGTKQMEEATNVVGLGRVTPSAKKILDMTGKSFEDLKMQKGIHHGSEDQNWLFPQELKNDYPITVIRSDGTVKQIEIDERNPHLHLFSYLSENKKIKNTINPAYIVRNIDDFNVEKLPRDLWTKSQLDAVHNYKRFVSENKNKASKDLLSANSAVQVRAQKDFDMYSRFDNQISDFYNKRTDLFSAQE